MNLMDVEAKNLISKLAQYIYDRVDYDFTRFLTGLPPSPVAAAPPAAPPPPPVNLGSWFSFDTVNSYLWNLTTGVFIAQGALVLMLENNNGPFPFSDFMNPAALVVAATACALPNPRTALVPLLRMLAAHIMSTAALGYATGDSALTRYGADIVPLWIACMAVSQGRLAVPHTAYRTVQLARGGERKKGANIEKVFKKVHMALHTYVQLQHVHGQGACSLKELTRSDTALHTLVQSVQTLPVVKQTLGFLTNFELTRYLLQHYPEIKNYDLTPIAPSLAVLRRAPPSTSIVEDPSMVKALNQFDADLYQSCNCKNGQQNVYLFRLFTEQYMPGAFPLFIRDMSFWTAQLRTYAAAYRGDPIWVSTRFLGANTHMLAPKPDTHPAQQLVYHVFRQFQQGAADLAFEPPVAKGFKDLKSDDIRMATDLFRWDPQNPRIAAVVQGYDNAYVYEPLFQPLLQQDTTGDFVGAMRVRFATRVQRYGSFEHSAIQQINDVLTQPQLQNAS
jgi:hypothetical protein